MKKYIRMSSAIALALGSFGEGKADSQNSPVLQVSGVGKVGAFFFKNSNKEGAKIRGEDKAKPDNKGLGQAFALQDTAMFFDAKGRLDSFGQMEYLWRIGLNLDSKKTSGQKVIEENSLTLRGDWGLVRFGDAQGVESFMATGAFVAAGGTGHGNGNFDTVVNKTTGIYTTTDLAGKTSYATKISYVTPRVSGLQFGISYTPNTLHSGEDDHTIGGHISSKGKPQDTNNWAGGINFSHRFENNLKMVLSATGLYGNTRKRMKQDQVDNPASGLLKNYVEADLHNTKSLALGAYLEYQGWEFGAEYVDNGKSQQIKNPTDVQANLGSFNAGKAYELALAYNYGPNKVAIGYYDSARRYAGKDAKARTISLSYDRALGKGLGFYVEAVNFNFKSHNDAQSFEDGLAGEDRGKIPREYQTKGFVGNNHGHVVSTGFKMSF